MREPSARFESCPQGLGNCTFVFGFLYLRVEKYLALFFGANFPEDSLGQRVSVELKVSSVLLQHLIFSEAPEPCLCEQISETKTTGEF